LQSPGQELAAPSRAHRSAFSWFPRDFFRVDLTDDRNGTANRFGDVWLITRTIWADPASVLSRHRDSIVDKQVFKRAVRQQHQDLHAEPRNPEPEERARDDAPRSKPPSPPRIASACRELDHSFTSHASTQYDGSYGVQPGDAAAVLAQINPENHDFHSIPSEPVVRKHYVFGAVEGRAIP
jgi:hypothetical protein